MRKFISKEKNAIFVFNLCLLASFLLVILVQRGGGDDTNFVTSVQDYSLAGWVTARYNSRSGRVLSEMWIYLMAYAPMIVWKLVDVMCYALLGTYLYKFSVLFSGKEHIESACASILCVFLMDIGASCDGMLWVTGAMNYLWIIVPGVIGIFYVAQEWWLHAGGGRKENRTCPF